MDKWMDVCIALLAGGTIPSRCIDGCGQNGWMDALPIECMQGQ